MEQIYDIKMRMRSIGEIRKMTNAMHLVSAVKTKNARAQLARTLPYFDLCRATMAEIYIQSPEMKHTFFNRHKKKKDEPWVVGFFILTGDRGLAGSYNLNVVKTAESSIHKHMIDLARSGVHAVPKLFLAGKTGKDFFIKSGFDVVENFKYPIDSPTFFRARDISDYIHDMYDEYKIDEVYAIYTRIKSAIDIKPVVVKLIPISSEDLLDGVDLDVYKKLLPDPATINMEFIPSPVEVMNYLAKTYLNGMIYGALTEAFASEQTARMTAMKNATDNAEDMLDELTLLSNRIRQSTITQEINEIVNGANSIGVV
ncbi:MAG: ATP synthase F1 subunit gamma [Saccharofermentanales bacterium]